MRVVIVAVQVPQNFIFRGISFRFVPFRASELALPRNSECLGMGTFFRGITETVPSLFRGIFSERNSVPNPTYVEYRAVSDVFQNSDPPPPPPSTPGECVRGRTHSLVGEGGGGPIFWKTPATGLDFYNNLSKIEANKTLLLSLIRTMVETWVKSVPYL